MAAGLIVAIREYQTDIGPADYALLGEETDGIINELNDVLAV